MNIYLRGFLLLAVMLALFYLAGCIGVKDCGTNRVCFTHEIVECNPARYNDAGLFYWETVKDAGDYCLVHGYVSVVLGLPGGREMDCYIRKNSAADEFARVRSLYPEEACRKTITDE